MTWTYTRKPEYVKFFWEQVVLKNGFERAVQGLDEDMSLNIMPGTTAYVCPILPEDRKRFKIPMIAMAIYLWDNQGEVEYFLEDYKGEVLYGKR